MALGTVKGDMPALAFLTDIIRLLAEMTREGGLILTGVEEGTAHPCWKGMGEFSAAVEHPWDSHTLWTREQRELDTR